MSRVSPSIHSIRKGSTVVALKLRFFAHLRYTPPESQHRNLPDALRMTTRVAFFPIPEPCPVARLSSTDPVAPAGVESSRQGKTSIFHFRRGGLFRRHANSPCPRRIAIAAPPDSAAKAATRAAPPLLSRPPAAPCAISAALPRSPGSSCCSG